MEESFAKKQKHRRVANPVRSFSTNTVKKFYIANIQFLLDFLDPENLDSTLLDVRINSPKCSFFRV